MTGDTPSTLPEVGLRPDATLNISDDDWIDTGATRSVYDLGELTLPDGRTLEAVLKLPKREGYELGNERELENWERLGGDPHLAEILAADPYGEWLVMEKVDANGDWSMTPDQRSDLYAWAEANGLRDMHLGNIGTRVSTGEPVVLDYGDGAVSNMNDDCSCSECWASRERRQG